MQSASSVNDAEHRAMNVLRAFEESTREEAEIEIKRIRKQNELQKGSDYSKCSVEGKRRRTDTEKTSRRSCKHCQSYEEQLTTAQRNNYSLGVHLREAMMNNSNGNNPSGGPLEAVLSASNRDVFRRRRRRRKN